MPRKFTRVNEVEKNGQRDGPCCTPSLGRSVSVVGLLCDVPCLRTWRFRRNRPTSEVHG